MQCEELAAQLRESAEEGDSLAARLQEAEAARHAGGSELEKGFGRTALRWLKAYSARPERAGNEERRQAEAQQQWGPEQSAAAGAQWGAELMAVGKEVSRLRRRLAAVEAAARRLGGDVEELTLQVPPNITYGCCAIVINMSHYSSTFN